MIIINCMNLAHKIGHSLHCFFAYDLLLDTPLGRNKIRQSEDGRLETRDAA